MERKVSCGKKIKIWVYCVKICHLINKGLMSATLFKKRLWHRCFPVKFAKYLRAPFFIEHLRWLFLKLQSSHHIRTSHKKLIQDFQKHSSYSVPQKLFSGYFSKSRKENLYQSLFLSNIAGCRLHAIDCGSNQLFIESLKAAASGNPYFSMLNCGKNWSWWVSGFAVLGGKNPFEHLVIIRE